jgi:hypothetical protein
LDPYEFTLDPNFVPVLDPANIQSLEILEDILVADPESAIIVLRTVLDVGQAHSLHELLSPLGTFVAPVTFPLVELKRTPKVQKQVAHDLFDKDDGECVALGKVSCVSFH